MPGGELGSCGGVSVARWIQPQGDGHIVEIQHQSVKELPWKILGIKEWVPKPPMMPQALSVMYGAAAVPKGVCSVL